MSDKTNTGGDSGSRANGLVVALLVLVGVMGAWIMYSSLFPAPAPKPAPGNTAPPPPGTPAQSVVDSMAARPGATRHVVLLPPFSEVATAEDLRGKLDKLGIASSLRIEAHVQIGPFRSAEEAEAARARLKELGVYGGQLTTLKP
ncbi:MAG: SPOR domain-containing protein [Rhodocyclales bacterium]|nr:SPOR domain-containing protein [Rhodocyclales bacterium]